MCSSGFEGDACTVWNEREVKARKEHRCGCCGGRIEAGTAYLAHSNLFDGSWTSEKMCLPCRDARKAFVDAHDGLIPTPTATRETISECVSDGDEESEKRWKPMLGAMDARRVSP